MKRNAKLETGDITMRPLVRTDLEAVVAIDARLAGRARRTPYFKRRLDAALADPKLHVQFAALRGGELAGYVLARRLAGEFGLVEPALRLEVIGVEPDAHGHGIGDALLDAIENWAGRHGVATLRTQATWRHHTMLRFLDRAGFELGRNQVIDCAVHAGRLGGTNDDSGVARLEGGTETNYGTTAANDFEALARDLADVRTLAAADAEAIVKVDRAVTGRDRSGYIAQLVREALDDSAIRVSLTARVSGMAVGFIMAKTDLGDFGRTAPVAVIDTIGVNPEFAHAGIGSALLSQLFVNLHALHIERVETVVSRENFDLLAFFYQSGFEPSSRLAFEKQLN
jgi:ribosomal protein S18 acetylase RimI-like enzyme